MNLKYFGVNNYTEYAESQSPDKTVNVYKIMQTQIYELMIYSAVHVIIYVFLLTLVNSPFGKRLWNSLVTRILGEETKSEANDSSDPHLPDTNVEEERHSVELNLNVTRKYITQ